MISLIFSNFDLGSYKLPIGPGAEGESEFLLPIDKFEQALEQAANLLQAGYSHELRGSTHVFERGWSYCLIKQLDENSFLLRIMDVEECADSRISAGGVDWAGVKLLGQPEGTLLPGPAWRHVQTWSIAHYFFGPIGFSDAVSLIGSQLREQSPRVVGPWTLPDEVWFDVRALQVDAKVRLKPSSLREAEFLFQRTKDRADTGDVSGVLIEVTGAESID